MCYLNCSFNNERRRVVKEKEISLGSIKKEAEKYYAEGDCYN